MKNKLLNGFEKSQIFKLYAFLVAYEESGIQNYRSTKALLIEHPELAELEKIMNVVRCIKSNAEVMKGVDFKALNNEIYFTKRKNNLFSFLSHLRNSIAHGNVVEHEGKVLITDCADPKRTPIDFTARGRVDFQVIEEFTNTINKIEL